MKTFVTSGCIHKNLEIGRSGRMSDCYCESELSDLNDIEIICQKKSQIGARDP
jgi:hypothetical protein